MLETAAGHVGVVNANDRPRSTAKSWSGGAATREPARRSTRDWPQRYAARLLCGDILVIALVMLAFRFALLPMRPVYVSWPGGPRVPYWVVLLIVAVLWLVALSAFDTRDRHVVGHGPQEYRRVVNATITLFAFCVAIAFFLRMEVSRGFFLVGIPVGLVLLLISRWSWRQWLRRQQRRGRYVHRALVLGEHVKAQHVINSIRREPGSGLMLVGVVTDSAGEERINRVPVIGDYSDIVGAMDQVQADTVVVAGADELEPATMRRLGWAVADRDGNLVVAPALTDVAGPRIHTRPAAGLPLVHVEFPRLEGAKRFGKRAFDIVVSGLLLIVLSPFMIATVIAIKLDSKGPVLYRQSRVGRGGREFGMLKFRSMVQDADDQLGSLLDLQGKSDRPLFKVVDDPRITKVGRFLRKHSIDELPQLWNVFVGDMSLVGPRPQRAAEVALYDDAARRRMLVKPGMSGLWQVSGRSQLEWEDALRLDLYYVENWSFMQDVLILFRTVRAVLSPGVTAH